MLTHKQKVKLAVKMPRTAFDDAFGAGKFDTQAWDKRKKSIADRVKRRQDPNRVKTKSTWVPSGKKWENRHKKTI